MDQNVQAPETGLDLSEHASDLFRVLDIGLKRKRVRSFVGNLARRLLSGLPVLEKVDQELRPWLRKAQSQSPPNASGAAGHKYNTAFHAKSKRETSKRGIFAGMCELGELKPISQTLPGTADGI